jgi:hypothetical protein
MKKIHKLFFFGFLLIVISQSCKEEPQPPTLILSATPQIIEYGGTTILTWETNNATSCIFSGGSLIDVNGSVTTPPLVETTTYNFTATGQGGTVSKSITIQVNEAPKPTINVTVDNDTVPKGSTVNILIESTNAVNIKIVGVTTGDTIPETTENSFPQLNGTFTSWELQKTTHFTITATGIDNSTVAADTHVIVPTKKDTLITLLCVSEWSPDENWVYVNDTTLVKYGVNEVEKTWIFKFNPNGTFTLKGETGNWSFANNLTEIIIGKTSFLLMKLTEEEMFLGSYKVIYDFEKKEYITSQEIGGYAIYRHK